MRRGTTPTHTFEIPFDVSLVSKAMVIYSQNDKELFCKETSDCNMSGNIMSVTLTQEDTLKLDCRRLVEIQLRILTVTGEALASEVMLVNVGKCLNNEVI